MNFTATRILPRVISVPASDFLIQESRSSNLDKQYLASNYFQSIFCLFVVHLPRFLTGLLGHMLLLMDWVDPRLYKQKEDGC